MKTLFTWVGGRDLNYVAKNGEVSDKFTNDLVDEKRHRPTVSPTSTDSPIFAIFNNRSGIERFQKTYLFFDMKSQVLGEGIKNYLRSYCDSVELIYIQASSSHSYSQLFEATVGEWRKIQAATGSDIEPYFNLSSGTSSMNALFIVLAQVSYRQKAKFIQVENKKVNEFNIDFDLGSYMTSETLRQIDQLAFDSITGNSAEIGKVKKQAAKAARTDFNVLIYGESGTGKELLAEAIWKASARKNKPYRAVNCALLAPQLLESELFGYKKGAFTGADKDKIGLLKIVDGGTLFLDEVEACPPEVQAKLLRVLQPPEGDSPTCRKFTPLGANKEEGSDVRIIAATNEKLNGTEFRNDLLNRLATLRLTMPPLRERGGDLPLLAETLLEGIKRGLGDEFLSKRLDDSAIKFIESRRWDGNIRELKNALVQALIFGEDESISAEDFDQSIPPRVASDTPSEQSAISAVDWTKPFDVMAVLKKHDLELKKKYIDRALEQVGGVKTRAAKLLGIPYQTLDNWQKTWEEQNEKEKP